jgi:hypothetical protein
VLSLIGSRGTVLFSNRVPGVYAPVFAQDGVTGLAGQRYLAQLYAGLDEDALVPVGPAAPFREEPAVGYWSSTDTIRYIPWVTGGQSVWVQVRTWETGLGSTFEETAAKGGTAGKSELLRVTPGGIGIFPSVPVNLTGLKSFNLRPAALPQSASSPDLESNERVELSPTLLGPELRFEGQAETCGFFLLENSTDLILWSELITFQSSTAEIQFTRFRSEPRWEFYRVRELSGFQASGKP